jgi:hypothetical protein
VVKRLRFRVDTPAVADDVGVDRVLVNIAVENLAPLASTGKAAVNSPQV